MNTSKNTIAKNVKGNKANDLTTISEMTNNFYPNANFRVLESLVLFWTSKVVFWRRRPDFTEVNTCQYIHTGTSDFRSEFVISKTSGALIGRAACFHESVQTWLWRQDVLLFARHLARGLELEKSLNWVENSTSLLYLPIPSSAETWKIFTKTSCTRLRVW